MSLQEEGGSRRLSKKAGAGTQASPNYEISGTPVFKKQGNQTNQNSHNIWGIRRGTPHVTYPALPTTHGQSEVQRPFSLPFTLDPVPSSLSLKPGFSQAAGRSNSEGTGGGKLLPHASTAHTEQSLALNFPEASWAEHLGMLSGSRPGSQPLLLSRVSCLHST